MRRYFPPKEQTGKYAQGGGHPDFPPLGGDTDFIGLYLTQFHRPLAHPSFLHALGVPTRFVMPGADRTFI